jgi:hypothetical protein
MNQKLRKILISALLTGTNYIARDYHVDSFTYWGYAEKPDRIESKDEPGAYRYCGGLTISLNVNVDRAKVAELFAPNVDVIDLHEFLHLQGTTQDFQEVYNMLMELHDDLTQHDPSVGIFAASEAQQNLLSLLAELIKPEEAELDE